MKVGIVTLHRVHNFGSALQTYATQELFRSNGFDAEVIDYRRPSEYPVVRDQIRYNFRRWDRNAASRAAFHALRGRQLKRQEENFDHFLRERVSLSARTYLTPRELREEQPSADLYCVGSDQVWNNDYHVPGSEGPYYLDFLGPGARKVSLSSSFGKSSLSQRDVGLVSSALRDFEKVSVRESSGVGLLASLGIDATHLVDPTLSQSGEAWRALAQAPSLPADYLVVYQLHRNHDLGAAIAQARREHKIETVIAIQGFWSPVAGRNRTLYNTSVEEFVGLLAYARHVVTDSFHGTAFAMNLGRPFTAVLPPRYSERIENLLSLTGTSDRIWRHETNNSADLDWDAIERELGLQRDRFVSFLRSIKEQ